MSAIRVCIIGGIYGKTESYQSSVKFTPETVLEAGLRESGIVVETFGHYDPVDFAQFDVVHVHHLSFAAVKAALDRSGCSMVFTGHDGEALCGMPQSAVKLASRRMVMSRADAVVALSNTEASFLSAYADRKRIKVIPNGIHSERFAFVAKSLPRVPSRFLYVGQLIALKRVDLLLRALSRLPGEWELSLAFHTDGELESLQGLTHDLGIAARCKFLGRQSPDELARLYQSSDCLLHASRAEALPSVITEALLCGTPVVATAVGAIPEQVLDFGAVVPPDSEDAFLAGIQALRANYGTVMAGAEEASRHARMKFSVPQMIRSHVDLYESLLRSKQERSRSYFDFVLRAVVDWECSRRARARYAHS